MADIRSFFATKGSSSKSTKKKTPERRSSKSELSKTKQSEVLPNKSYNDENQRKRPVPIVDIIDSDDEFQNHKKNTTTQKKSSIKSVSDTSEDIIPPTPEVKKKEKIASRKKISKSTDGKSTKTPKKKEKSPAGKLTRTPKKNASDFFGSARVTPSSKRKKNFGDDEPPVKKERKIVVDVVEVVSSGDEKISSLVVEKEREKTDNNLEAVNKHAERGRTSEARIGNNNACNDEPLDERQIEDLGSCKKRLSMSKKLTLKGKGKTKSCVMDDLDKSEKVVVVQESKKNILCEEDFEMDELLKGYMNEEMEKEEKISKLVENLESAKIVSLPSSQEVEKESLIEPEIANQQIAGVLDDINLDDSFDTADLDLIPTESNSKTVVTDLVSLNDSFAELASRDLEDVIIKTEEDISIVHTWKITEVDASESRVKVLHLKYLGADEISATCSLQGDWFYMKTSKDDVVYVSALSKTKTHCVLDNTSKHYLIMYPNTLISGTTIAGGITCERMAVLNTRFNKMMGTTNKAMFLGTLTHDLFDWVLRNKGCTLQDVQERARQNLNNSKYLETLSLLGVDVEGIIESQSEYHSSLVEWSKQFMTDNTDGASVELKIGNEKTECSTNLHIDEVVDIEENVWSPYYGFKGKIDATVKVTLHRKPKIKGTETRTKYKLPLEFKTGKLFSALGSIEHRAQVAVYTLLLSERYDTPIDFGLLLYGKTNHMIGVPRPEQEKRAILIKRNEIAQNLTLERTGLQMPPLIQNRRTCKRCDQNATCMLYFKSLENGNAETSGLPELFTELTSHLGENDTAYFAKWYELCILEASHMNKESSDKYIWRSTAEQREKQGICFSGMKRDSFEYSVGGKFVYSFKRKEGHFNQECSLKLVPLTCGDRVIISEEKKRVYNLTTGYITDVSDDILTVSVYHEVRAISLNKPGAVYRIDKDDTLSNYTTPLCNLAELFRVDSPTDEKLRKLIVSLDEPTFSLDKDEEINNMLQTSKEDSYELSLLSTQRQALSEVLSELNNVQRSAIKKCLSAEDYIVIHGMPGCGKSTTIACLVRALVSVGKTVLLSSYTHSAVDTILTKLLKVGFSDFLRLGASSRVHEKILPYTYEERTKSFTTVEEYKQLYVEQKVVAATCLGIHHPVLVSKRFDYCIVDEASQITQPVCIGPLRSADIFVLVGDHNQLPPLVLSTKAQQNGLDCSLFKTLSDLQNDALVQLNYQYRMNADIMFLTNSLIYDNLMKCGNDAIANALLNLPHYEKELGKSDPSPFWKIIDPQKPVVYVNTDTVKYLEEKSQSYIVNRGEAALVKKLVDKFIQCGLSALDIGVISMYRHQVNLLRNELAHIDGFIEVDTMDKYQGKDKSCIIISFVRSNDSSEVGELLKDWRRINVAITRAKTKLVMIGSKNTLGNSEILERLLKLVDLKEWCLDLVDEG